MTGSSTGGGVGSDPNDEVLVDVINDDPPVPDWVIRMGQDPAFAAAMQAQLEADDPDWWRDEQRLMSVLDATAPGPKLAGLIAQIDLGAVSDEAVVQVTAAVMRLTSWTQAIAAQGAGELSRRESMNPDWPEHVRAKPGIAADEDPAAARTPHGRSGAD